LVDGFLGFENKQIEEAAKDPAVKAVVVRIDSPGGTISASDDLLRRLNHLRDGTTPKFQFAGKSAKKPLVVSIGTVAASGGYYIAMAAAQNANDANEKKLFAERSTLTGSIGVYASFPNLKELGDKYGVKFELINAGDIKASGSMFHEMSPQERQPWQDMVLQSYDQFIEVLDTGRPQLNGNLTHELLRPQAYDRVIELAETARPQLNRKLTDELFPPKEIPAYDDKGNRAEKSAGMYTRKRADGGVFTASEAKKYGLIDAIGTVDDAVAE